MSIHIFILAGGSGKRLWPLSIEELPKQFLRLEDKHSFFQTTCKRFSSIKNSFIHVLTTQALAPVVKKELEEIHMQASIIIEPFANNTLAALTNGLKYAGLKSHDFFLVIPSDHYLSNIKGLFHLIEGNVAQEVTNSLVVFGVKPSFPHTGYGYIQIKTPSRNNVFKVKRFIEKPPLSCAKKWIHDSSYLWNTGMLFGQYKQFLMQLTNHAQMHYKYIVDEIPFEDLPNVSIDTAILEKTKSLSCYQLDQLWLDIGSWDGVYDLMEKDQQQNAILGSAITLDTKNTLIISKEKTIATVGIEDLFIIESENAILIGKKQHSQKVKELASQFNAKFSSDTDLMDNTDKK